LEDLKVLLPELEEEEEAEWREASIVALGAEEVVTYPLGANIIEARGTRGRGRGEGGRGRGRGGVPVSSDATSTAATIASEETPAGWGDSPSFDDTAIMEPDLNGINGTNHYEETPSAAAWGGSVAIPVEESLATTVNGTAPQRPSISSTPSRQSRIVDPTSKFSWASIVKPPAPPPIEKPAPQPQSAPQYQEPPVSQGRSRPSTRGQDFIEESAQTIHDPFATAEPSKPKVQLPQPVLPYIPSMISQQKEHLPGTEPLTSRNLDLLEDQQSPVPEPSSASITAHRASPAPKSEGPPGLSARFARNSRDTPVILPGIASQSLGGMQLQFGYVL
jgi:hypothetical protein